MNRAARLTIISLAALGSLAGCAADRAGGTAAGPGAGCGGACGGVCQIPEATGAALAPASADALRAALADERRTKAYYEGVLARHGQVMPFGNIVHAEDRHAQAIITLMNRYSVPVPGDAPANVPAIPSTLRECNLVAAQAERDNIAVYDRLLPTIAEADVRSVFERLRAVSKDNHLRAFERAAG